MCNVSTPPQKALSNVFLLFHCRQLTKRRTCGSFLRLSIMAVCSIEGRKNMKTHLERLLAETGKLERNMLVIIHHHRLMLILVQRQIGKY
jgi:hypothetical protein